jgi:hypothetical protein
MVIMKARKKNLRIGREYRPLITALGYQLELNNGELDIKALEI